MERAGDAHHMALSEASHGTAELYGRCTTPTRKPSQEAGPDFVEVERTDRHVRAL